jgi:anti-sigma factor RsiW
MNCKAEDNDLFLYAEGSLPEERKAFIDAHLTDCPQCAALLLFLRKSQEVIEADREVEENPFLYTRILAKLQVDENRKAAGLKRLIPAFVFCTVVLAAIIGGIKLGSLYSVNFSGYANELKEEKGYINDFSQESIEIFFLTNNDEGNE